MAAIILSSMLAGDNQARRRGRPPLGSGRGIPQREGRGQVNEQRLPAPDDDSGEEDEEVDLAALAINPQRAIRDLDVAEEQPPADAILGEFPVVNDDDDETEEGNAVAAAQDPIFEYISTHALDNQEHVINHEFESGFRQNETTLADKYAGMSPVDIFLDLSWPLWDTLLSCSNRFEGVALERRDMYLYGALLVLRTLLPMGHIEHYWYPPPFMLWSPEIAAIRTLLPLARYFYIRRNLKGYMPEDLEPARSKGVKVLRAVDAVARKFRQVLPHPGEHLSAIEGMANGTSTRNPIYTSLGRAKPLEGFRFFLLVDCETKIVLNFMLDTKDLNATNCANEAGGFSGAVIAKLIDNAWLPGSWYKLWTDNYYISLPLVRKLLQQRRILLGGTVKRCNTTSLVHFGEATRPRPSVHYPKGTLKVAKVRDEDIYLYGWMDSAAVYFIDSMAGPGRQARIDRKDEQGRNVSYTVPAMIQLYNAKMHAEEVFDQVCSLFGCDPAHTTRKFTVRVFEILQSMILTQAYNIYRHIHKGNPERQMSHTDFKLSIVLGILSHGIVHTYVPTAMEVPHRIAQWPERSGNNGRRKQMRCENCARKKADGSRVEIRTTYYCTQCMVGLHPQCFAEYHTRLSEGRAPRKRPKSAVRTEV